MGEQRIKHMFNTVREQNRPGLIVFVTAGFPDMDATLELVPALVAAGADEEEVRITIRAAIEMGRRSTGD